MAGTDAGPQEAAAEAVGADMMPRGEDTTDTALAGNEDQPKAGKTWPGARTSPRDFAKEGPGGEGDEALAALPVPVDADREAPAGLAMPTDGPLGAAAEQLVVKALPPRAAWPPQGTDAQTAGPVGTVVDPG